HLKAVVKMADIAEAIGEKEDAAAYRKRYAEGVPRFNQALWMPKRGAYRDGIGTNHTAAHATFFPMAFGLLPEENHEDAIKFLAGKGMACSVYAAQYFMEALFENGGSKIALALMTADGDRSWKHMVNSGTTITWEAWDQKYKPNQDWNHAWGAAPGNLLPRYILGVEPVEPGFKRFRIAPRSSGLTYAKGKVPTPLGPIEVNWKIHGNMLKLQCTVPEGSRALVEFPEFGHFPARELGPGTHRVEVKLEQ
ncbi:MAG: alpha-L-rhamnosidase C-terminal domain-containing protein, partial [Opitutales bacterium]